MKRERQTFRSRRITVPLFAAAFITASTLSAADAPKKSGSLDGVWKPFKAELSGKSMGQPFLDSITLTVKDSNYDVFVSTGNSHDKGTTKINPNAKPKALDTTGTNGPNVGKTILAIYEIDGDTLRVCYDLSGAKRPAEFKSATNSPLFLVTYKRQKDSK